MDLEGDQPLVHQGRSLLPVRVRYEDRRLFSVPPTELLTFQTMSASLGWWVYEATESPRVVFEGIDTDYWMHEQASLRLRLQEPVHVRLQYFSFLAPDHTANEISVCAGAVQVASCHAGPEQAGKCEFA